MEATKQRLGRGLDALLSGTTPAEPHTGSALKVEQIVQNPYQPRKRFDDDDLKQLADSIRSHGILQPLVVRQTADGYQLIAGERRLRAAQQAGLSEVPVHIVAFDDQQVYEAALVENIQRADLNPIEKAVGFKDYLDRYGLKVEQLAAKLGLDRTTVSNFLGLLNLPAEVQDAVRLGQISLGHAKVLKGLADADRQIALCKLIVLQNLSVRALESLVKEQDTTPEPGEKPAKELGAKFEKTAHVSGIENELRQKLAVRLEIKVKAQDRGQIVIGFESNDDFERIVAALQK
jgi:ParB family chromosome partitioning protein